VVRDKDDKPIFSRPFTVKNSDRKRGLPIKDIPLVEGGDTVIVVQSPDGSVKADPITIRAAAAAGSNAQSARTLSAKGGPVLLSVGGLVVSQQAQNFNQADPFFGFLAGYMSDRHKGLGGWRWNIRFQGIFTASGRAAEATNPSDPGGTDGAGGADAPADDADAFKYIASRKSFDFDTHAWIDFFADNAFSIGPYGAWGASAVMDKNELQGEAVIVDDGNDSQSTAEPVATESKSDNDLKQFRELGLIMNLKKDNNRKLVMQAIIARGWYEAFKDLDRDNDTRNRFVGKLRIFPMGLDLLGDAPITPMLGIDLNAGTGPDHVKFFSGFSIRLSGLPIAR
jgi:hypothetical protein